MKAGRSLSSAVRASHADLSPAALAYLEKVLERPDALRFVDFRHAAETTWARDFPFEIQPWPLLIDEAKRREVTAATSGVTRLIKSLPERYFGGDAGQISRFYGFPNPLLIALLLEPPNGLAGAYTRCDLLDDGTGVKVIEVNASAFLGGFQLRFWEPVYRAYEPFADFLAEAGLTAHYQDPLRVVLGHVADECLERGTAVPDRIGVAVVVGPELLAARALPEQVNRLFADVLRERDPALRGEVLFRSYPAGLAVGKGGVEADGTAVDAVIEYTDLPTPEGVYRAFKNGRISLYNGPASNLIGDKRNLALLWEAADGGLLSDEEKALVEHHVPWCRRLEPGAVTYGGEERELVELLLAARGEFVIKPAVGAKGENVVVGEKQGAEVWEARVRSAAEAGGWVAQQYVASRPYLFQHGAEGVAEQSLVWGVFTFGDTYGGGFLRYAPREGGDGVINAARGAREGLIFEV